MGWWLVELLMILASYRLTRLVVRDTFPPVLWLRDRLAGGWRDLTLAETEEYYRASASRKAVLSTDWSYHPGDEEDDPHQRYVVRWKHSPFWLAELITCPWCASAYVSGAVTLAVDLTVGVPVPWLVGVSVWAGSSLLASREWA